MAVYTDKKYFGVFGLLHIQYDLTVWCDSKITCIIRDNMNEIIAFYNILLCKTLSQEPPLLTDKASGTLGTMSDIE